MNESIDEGRGQASFLTRAGLEQSDRSLVEDLFLKR
jgi:hypothetical protein